MAKPATNQKQATFDLPGDVVHTRLEKNLLQIGFFGAHDPRTTRNELTRNVELWVRAGGKRHLATGTITSALGLPGTADRDKYMAFEKIALEQKRMNGGVLENPIRFSGYQMLRLLDLSVGGNNYDDLRQWGERMANVTIKSDNIIYSKRKKAHLTDNFHVFKRFSRISTSNLDDTDQATLYSVQLEEWLLDSLNQGYAVPQDLTQYRKLKRPIAKGIFVNLTFWFFASKGSDVERDYEELCSYLHVASYKHLSKIKETMGKSLDELVSIEYLSSWDIVAMTSKKGYKVVMRPGRSVKQFLELMNGQKERNPLIGESAPSDLTEDQQEAYEAMVALGISSEKSSTMCRQMSVDVLMDRLDYILKDIEQKGTKIANPPGFAIKFLESKDSIPAHFETMTERRKGRASQAKEAALQQTQNDAVRELLQWRERYETWVKQKVEEANFSKDEIQDRVDRYLEDLTKTNKRLAGQIRRMPHDMQQVQLKAQIVKILAAELEMPSFEEWFKSASKQRSLFA